MFANRSWSSNFLRNWRQNVNSKKKKRAGNWLVGFSVNYYAERQQSTTLAPSNILTSWAYINLLIVTVFITACMRQKCHKYCN